MDLVMNVIESLFRWLHVFFGIVWIGHLYFFNWVNANFNPTMDAETKKKVVPELMPRALFWFRMGAAMTWVTGFFLAGMVYYMNAPMLFDGNGWNAMGGILVLLTFGAPFIYEVLFGKVITDAQQQFFAGIAIAGIMLCLYAYVGGMGFRGTAIHLGALFGTTMAYNVWFKIWPAQQKIITAIKNGEAPDAALVGMAGTRSKHNTYMSGPLVFMMISQHATWASGAASPILLTVVVALGFGLIYQIYEAAKGVKGF